uniref:Uncharacterized protein n=1 Tax=Marseillevirus LCMAC103 TaxID=2506604 RepID=A0A481YV44_9VIRU|nr:MAG: hypothetical protein LCMAC103_02480 [Marseillevirus LCMAC103]
MRDTKNLCIIVGVLLLLAAVVFLCSRAKKHERYSNLGDITNIGAVDAPGFHGSDYELVEAAEQHAPTPHFADLIDSGAEQATRQPATLHRRAPRRLAASQGADLLPRIAKHVTPYNIDVADPITHSYMVNPPRVQLKDPLKQRADPFRGDVPIKYHPNLALIGNSRYGRDSLRLDGFFSDHYKALYNKYTGKGFKNMPIHVVNEETIMDA